MNQTTITGNVGSEDGVLSQMPGGKPVLNFNFANNETWKDQKNEKQTRTTWYKVAIFDDRAINLAPFIVSGKKMLITGNLSVKAWKTEQGEAKANLTSEGRSPLPKLVRSNFGGG